VFALGDRVSNLITGLDRLNALIYKEPSNLSNLSNLFRTVRGLAKKIDIFHRLLGVEPTHPGSINFVWGFALGVRIVQPIVQPFNGVGLCVALDM